MVLERTKGVLESGPGRYRRTA